MNEKETKNTLTDRQCQAIPHLLAAKSLEEGCRQAKIAKNTFYSWLQNEAFREELRKQREKIVEGAFETLKASMNKASETLVKLLDSQNEGIQHKAAKDIIDYTVNSMEIEDLESRIEALENRMEQPKRHLQRNV